MPAALHHRPGGLDREVDERVEFNRSLVNRDLSLRDPGDVEQVEGPALIASWM
jgi:hypothetical protein